MHEYLSQLDEVRKAALALDLTVAILSLDRILMMLVNGSDYLDRTYTQFHLSIVHGCVLGVL